METTGRVIALIGCIMCSLPLFIISHYEKDSVTPITFWSGDKSLTEKVKDVKSYNQKMAKLYGKCAAIFLLTGVAFLILPVLGAVLIVLDCTAGIYIVWRCYKRILESAS